MSGFRLLALFAHPDDEAFPVGGALAAHAVRGVEIRLITATLGEEGEIRQEGAATRETLPSVRRVELACAVRALGLAAIVSWATGTREWPNPRPTATQTPMSTLPL